MKMAVSSTLSLVTLLLVVISVWIQCVTAAGIISEDGIPLEVYHQPQDQNLAAQLEKFRDSYGSFWADLASKKDSSQPNSPTNVHSLESIARLLALNAGRFGGNKPTSDRRVNAFWHTLNGRKANIKRAFEGLVPELVHKNRARRSDSNMGDQHVGPGFKHEEEQLEDYMNYKWALLGGGIALAILTVIIFVCACLKRNAVKKSLDGKNIVPAPGPTFYIVRGYDNLTFESEQTSPTTQGNLASMTYTVPESIKETN